MFEVEFCIRLVPKLFGKLFRLISYLHSHFYRPFIEFCLETIFGISEEFSKSIVRESFNHIIRFLNGVFLWIVSFLERAKEAKTPSVFPSWQNLRPSSLNSVIDQETRLQEPLVDDTSSDKDSFTHCTLLRWWCQLWKRNYSKAPNALIKQTETVRELLERHGGFGFFFKRQYRGWVEDCGIAFEMGITKIFRTVRKLVGIVLLVDSGSHSTPDVASKLTDSHTGHPHLTRRASMPDLSSERDSSGSRPLTAGHFISEAGYPHESHSVTTDDGYILCLHRLPRKTSRETVFFQHGVLDTSLGWVASGMTGSLAFAAWDHGYDVWLGNSRANPPRRHLDEDIRSDQYWRYTLNELGMKDVGAQISYIHELKCKELENEAEWSSGSTTTTSPLMLQASKSEALLTGLDRGNPPLEDTALPYSLQVVGHSLGAAALLIYLVNSLCKGQRHFIKRMILMSPAGFHHVYPPMLYPLRWIVPPCYWIMERVFGKRGGAIMIPGSYTRLIFFKVFQDAVQIPAIRQFMKRGIRWLMNGDVSPWEFVMQLPHYNAESMPGISVHTGLHLIQLLKTGRFQLYDYGTPQENFAHYERPEPVDLAGEYWRIDIPVDVIAGRQDGIIPPVCVQRHVAHMLNKGVPFSYREFEYGHLEFSATVAHDLRSYVLERLSCR
eukprot:g3910.t1